MSATDERECDRCGKHNPAGRAIDPAHSCPHGKPCTTSILKDCLECLLAYRARRRLADVRSQALASLTPSPLAALGGTARGGVKQ